MLNRPMRADDSYSRPHLPAYQRARSGNGFAVLRFAAALRVPAAARVDCLEASGRGTSFRAARGFDLACGPHRTGNKRISGTRFVTNTDQEITQIIEAEIPKQCNVLIILD